MSIFTPRTAFKPFEYPDVVAYKEAINHSYWLVTEWNFISDIHDFNVNLTAPERNAIKNTLLAISQIEVSIKKFWTRLGDRFPKPEFEQVGVTFGESEVRHSDAYSHLLQVLGLNGDFERVLEVPAIQGRVGYLAKYLKGSAGGTDQNYALTLALFSIFVENVSLFSQFAVIKSFNKNRKVLKDIDNVVQATLKEEEVHALLGVCILNHIRREHPDWFDAAFYAKIAAAAEKAFRAECGIIDWIFEAGELPFLPKASLVEFVKDRFNQSVMMIGGSPPFVVDPAPLEPLRWFTEELHADVNTDFFHKRPVTYQSKSKPITDNDLF